MPRSGAANSAQLVKGVVPEAFPVQWSAPHGVPGKKQTLDKKKEEEEEEKRANLCTRKKSCLQELAFLLSELAFVRVGFFTVKS